MTQEKRRKAKTKRKPAAVTEGAQSPKQKTKPVCFSDFHSTLHTSVVFFCGFGSCKKRFPHPFGHLAKNCGSICRYTLALKCAVLHIIIKHPPCLGKYLVIEGEQLGASLVEELDQRVAQNVERSLSPEQETPRKRTNNIMKRNGRATKRAKC